MSASLWEPVSFNTPLDVPKKNILKSEQDRDENTSHKTSPKSPKMPNHPIKRKSKRKKQIHLTREYLESLGIPSFEDETYDNGYLYANTKPNKLLDVDTDDDDSDSDNNNSNSNTATSYRPKRLRPTKTKKDEIKTNEIQDDTESDSFYESDCNESAPFAINTSSIHTVPISSDLIKIIKSSHNIKQNNMFYDDDDVFHHIKSNINHASNKKSTKKGRIKTRKTLKKHRKMNMNDLDPLTQLFFDFAKEITSDLIHHKKARHFRELSMNDFTKFEWNDVIKQIVDLETVSNQLLNGHYFNDETYLISSFKQWKSDIKTVFENFAIIYGPKKHRKNKNYTEIYNNCYIMLCFFNDKLMEIQKAIKKITKRSDDWSKNKNGKYYQYIEDKDELLRMIYDSEIDECRNRDIQYMHFIYICPKRKLQLKHGKFNKKHIDVLPLRTLQKLARRGCNRNNRAGVNGTAIREQKKYFWAQYLHSKNSLQSAMKKLQRRIYIQDTDDDIDSDDDIAMYG